MNRNEWLKLPNSKEKWQYRNVVRSIQLQLIYNANPKANVIHHLLDTEEQRKYNNEHYERFGLNQDGTFEYGKYVIFVTNKEHAIIHSLLEETRNKISKAVKKSYTNERRVNASNIMKARWKNPCFREKMHRLVSGVPLTDETKQKISESNKARWQDPDSRNNRIEIIKRATESYWTDERREQARINNTGEKNPMFGKHPKESARSKMSESAKLSWNDERRKKYSEMLSGECNPFYGKHHSEESKKKMSESRKGKHISEDHKKKIGESHKGKIISDATKMKMSASNKLNRELKLRFNKYANTLTFSELKKLAKTTMMEMFDVSKEQPNFDYVFANIDSIIIRM
jgi:hypothetical protein